MTAKTPADILASLPRKWEGEAYATNQGAAYGNGLRECARELREVLAKGADGLAAKLTEVSAESDRWRRIAGRWEAEAATEVAHAEELRAQLAEVTAERDKAYRERAALVAYLAACYPSVWDVPEDVSSDDPDAERLIRITTPSGQMCWRVSWRDLELFPHVPPGDANWDGHTAEQKYERLAEMTRTVATGAHGPQPTADLENS